MLPRKKNKHHHSAPGSKAASKVISQTNEQTAPAAAAPPLSLKDRIFNFFVFIAGVYIDFFDRIQNGKEVTPADIQNYLVDNFRQATAEDRRADIEFMTIAKLNAELRAAFGKQAKKEFFVIAYRNLKYRTVSYQSSYNRLQYAAVPLVRIKQKTI
jgi:hypothetical protein